MGLDGPENYHTAKGVLILEPFDPKIVPGLDEFVDREATFPAELQGRQLLVYETLRSVIENDLFRVRRILKLALDDDTQTAKLALLAW